MNITRKRSTRPRETVHSVAKNGPAIRGGGPATSIAYVCTVGADAATRSPPPVKNYFFNPLRLRMESLPEMKIS